MEKEELNVNELERTESGKYVLPLEEPVQWGEEKVTHLELEAPKTKHLRGLGTSPSMNDILKIVADLSGRTDSFIDEMSMKDGTKASEFFSSFM